jgi:hypothetical protein
MDEGFKKKKRSMKNAKKKCRKCKELQLVQHFNFNKLESMGGDGCSNSGSGLRVLLPTNARVVNSRLLLQLEFVFEVAFQG